MTTLLLTLFAACAPAYDDTEACPFVVSTAFTPTSDGTYQDAECYVPTSSGYDFTACCPAPYVVVGVLSIEEVVCG